MPFCKGCGRKIEWHPRADGKMVAIDPDPHPEGTLAFGPGMKLQLMQRGAKPRMYRYHLSSCPNPDKARTPSASTCDRDGCTRTGPHRHCYRCGDVDHLASECPNG